MKTIVFSKIIYQWYDTTNNTLNQKPLLLLIYKLELGQQ